ncbi:terminase small subunit [Raoultella ornithinolytica]|uniref:terminase small subunit n=1 Tax=Raoultella ornithinolytica TaxID=54291 RepID=UPI0023509788|nr:terminase small subunit [Raoultella ornithinolytica]MDC7941358.1 terminase small subunit [Raoultella ornithinolytica]
MAKLDWGELQLQFLSDHAKTGISPEVWCESRGLKYSNAKRYIVIAKRSANSQKKTANKTANSQKEKSQKKEKSPPPVKAQVTNKITPEIDLLDIDFYGISDQQSKFAQLIVDGKSRVDAYREAGYSGEGATAYSNASRMLRNARVSRYVHHLRNERQKRYSAELDEVISQLKAIINANPNEISQYRRVNCRYCWGHQHKYQWRDIAEQLAAERKAEKDGVAPPDTSGGIGFIDNSDPNPECSRCNGEGIGEAFFADTRDVEGDARYLLHGVKLGKFGIEILTADKDSARKELARLILLRATSDRQSQLDIERLELQNEKLRHEIELIKDGDKDNAIVVHNALPIPGR